MAAVQQLFGRHAAAAGVASPRAWEAFGADLAAFGLGSAGLSALLRRVGAQAFGAGRAVAFADLLEGAAVGGAGSASDAAKIVQDLRQDAAALRRFVDYVRATYADDGPERAALEAGLEGVADAYRTGLVHLLRLATREAETIDERQRQTLLIGPIEAALRDEAGAFATLDAASLAPSPFDFQRVHCRAINVRLAAVYSRSRQVARHQRLHRLDRPGVAAAAAAAAEAAAASAAAEGRGGANDEIAATVGSATFRKAAPAVHTGSSSGQAVEIFLGTRLGTTVEECAAAAVPFELEVVRAPALGVLDGVATASVTLGSFQAAAAITPSLYQPLEDPLAWLRAPLPAGTSRAAAAAASAAHATTAAHAADFAMQKGEFASHMAAGGAPVPAPSAIPSVARAHSSSSPQLFADYCAHSELILSPYFADTCGVHESKDGAQGLVLGPASLFCYEFVPAMVPLSQLVSVCGRLPEGRPLFRHLAAELVRALADVEAQCCFALAPGSITAENVYICERGTRLLLRGIAWGDPIAPGRDYTEATLAQRSRVLLKTFGEVLRGLLVDAAPVGGEGGGRGAGDEKRRGSGGEAEGAGAAGEGEGEGEGEGQCAGEGEGELLLFNRAGAELGIHVASGARVELVLPHSAEELGLAPLPGGAGAGAAAAARLQGLERAVWLPPAVRLTGSGDAAGVALTRTTTESVPAPAHVPAPLSSASSAGPPPLPLPHAQHPSMQKRTRMALRAVRESHHTLTFYLVGADSESARNALHGSGGGGAASARRAAAGGPAPGTVAASGFLAAAPLSSDILAAAAVPLAVHARRPSPTLSLILDACDPRPEESAAVATLRLLSVLVARATGMVDGKRGGAMAAASGADAGVAASDQIHDDETFLVVVRQVAAVLRLNKGASDDPDGGGFGGHGSHGPAGKGLVSGRGKAAAAAAASAASASAEVSDVDAFAALLAAMEAAPQQLAPRGGGGEGRGGSAADADAEAERGRPADKKAVRWVSHLARHPYFAGSRLEDEAIMGEWDAWSWPLAHLHGGKLQHSL